MINSRKIKHKLVGYLEQYEFYFKFKYSPIVYAFLKKKNPKLQQAINAEAKLYKSILTGMSDNSLIFDIGANLGYTSEIFCDLGGTVIAIEPDIINLNCLRARFSSEKNITIVPMAVSDTVANETIYLQDKGDALHTLSNKWKGYLENDNDRWSDTLTFSKKRSIQTTTLEELIRKYGTPYFIKIDVEGYEEKVIRGLKTSVPLLSFEANLPQFLEETINCIGHIDGLSKTVTFNYAKHDKLLLPQYITKDKMIQVISDTELRCIDIFCKM